MARTINDILQGYEKDQTPEELQTRWDKIENNLKKYPLVEIYQAKEKLRKAAKALAKKHATELKKIMETINILPKE